MKSIFHSILEHAKKNPDAVSIWTPDIKITRKMLLQGIIGFVEKLDGFGVSAGSAVKLHASALTTNLFMASALMYLGATSVSAVEEKNADFTFYAREANSKIPINSIEIDNSWLSSRVSSVTRQAKEPIAAVADIQYLMDAMPELPIWATTGSWVNLNAIYRAIACLAKGGVIIASYNAEDWQATGVNIISGYISSFEKLFEEKIDFSLKIIIDILDVIYSGSVVNWSLKGFTVQQYLKARNEHLFYKNIWQNSGSCGYSLGSSNVSAVDFSPLENFYSIENNGFPTGYYGTIDQDSILKIFTSSEHVAKINGQFLNLLELDSYAELLDAVNAAIFFQNPKLNAAEELFAFIEMVPGFNTSQTKALLKVNSEERFGKEGRPRVVQIVGQVPRNEDGRPNRLACKKFILELASRSA